MRRLEDKVIFIAGSGGIGAGLARRYADEGAKIVLGDIDVEGARRVAADIADAGGTALATQFDGGDEESIDRAIALAATELGRLDGLHVNYVGTTEADSSHGVLDVPMEALDDSYWVNTRGYVLATRAALRLMLPAGGGSIVYTSSGAAYIGEPVRVAYAINKAGLHALMRHVASRYGAEGVRANCIAPGIILHDRFPPDVREAIEESSLQDTSIKTRLGCPEDIAAAGAYLLSSDAGYVTGQVISVDGGMTARA